MTGQQLKNTILQEAIEGRLVPQDPNDEPASVLLDKIRKEKARLVKEGKLKKKDLEEKPISDEDIPFEIPETWEWVRLKAVSRSITDGDHMPPPKADSGIPFLVISNVIKGYIDFSNTRFVPQSYFDSITLDRKAEEGDVLFTVTGSYGKAVLNRANRCFCFQRHIALIKPLIYSAFVEAMLNSPYIKTECDDKATGMAQKTVGIDTLRSFIVPLPPLAEQKRIVAKIEELLPKVEEYGKAQDALDKLNAELPERLKKSILQEAIEGRLVPQDPNDEPTSVLLDKIRKEKARLVKEGKLKKKDLEETPISEDEKPFEIPEAWEWVHLKFICNSFIVPQRDKPTKFDGDIPWCRIEDIDGKYLNGSKSNQLVSKELADSMNMHLCPKGTVICACSASIGNQAITTVDCYTNQPFIGIVCKDYVLYNEYLYYFFMSQKQALKELGKGTTISYISRKKFEDYLFPLPPLAEQHRIVAKIEQLMKEIDKLKA